MLEAFRVIITLKQKVRNYKHAILIDRFFIH